MRFKYIFLIVIKVKLRSLVRSKINNFIGLNIFVYEEK